MPRTHERNVREMQRVRIPALMLVVPLILLAAPLSLAATGDRDDDGIPDAVDLCPDVPDPSQLDGDGDRVGNACDRIVQDLSDAAFLAFGPAVQAILGYGLAVGDLDNDGTDELIIGAPFVDTGPQSRGVAYVLPGPLAGQIDLAASAPGTTLWSSDDFEYGADAVIGDLDGDGGDDIVVGAPGSWGYCSCDTCFGGGLSLVSGTTATAEPILDTTGAAMYWFSTCAERIGGHLALGDVDGDETLDLLASPIDGGYAYLYRDDPFNTPPYDADVRMWGSTSPFDEAGRDLAMADLDGDGLKDIVLGAPGAAGPADLDPEAGGVYIVRGVASGMPATIQLDLEATARIHGDAAGDRAGESIAVTDWDGDGRDDLIIGAPGADGPVGMSRAEAGAVFIVLGRDSIASFDGERLEDAATVRADGDVPGARLGTTVAAGDLDGDGAVDALLLGDRGAGPAGERPEAGSVRVLPRARIPDRARIDLARIGPSWIVHGASPGDGLALNSKPIVATLTGGAHPDLVVGAAWANGPGETRSYAGEVGVMRQPDRDGDGRVDELDCLPDDPASIGIGPTGSDSYFEPVGPTLVWSAVPGAESYALYRGTIDRWWRNDATCLVGGLSVTQAADASIPPPSTGYWYDTAAENATCSGPLGSSSTGVARTIPAACP